jgi:hypothetical protein
MLQLCNTGSFKNILADYFASASHAIAEFAVEFPPLCVPSTRVSRILYECIQTIALAIQEVSVIIKDTCKHSITPFLALTANLSLLNHQQAFSAGWMHNPACNIVCCIFKLSMS